MYKRYAGSRLSNVSVSLREDCLYAGKFQNPQVQKWVKQLYDLRQTYHAGSGRNSSSKTETWSFPCGQVLVLWYCDTVIQICCTHFAREFLLQAPMLYSREFVLACTVKIVWLVLRIRWFAGVMYSSRAFVNTWMLRLRSFIKKLHLISWGCSCH